jgi:predicted HTH domain antitoxin
MMKLKEVEIRVPEELRTGEVVLALAVELYREGRLTLKQAADLGGFCVEDFMKLLSERGFSVINWDVAELEQELKHADSF